MSPAALAQHRLRLESLSVQGSRKDGSAAKLKKAGIEDFPMPAKRDAGTGLPTEGFNLL